jgi:anti-sigma regulatory factor (Ser/Thr protein kinase)
MIWKILFPGEVTILLPQRFNSETMLSFVTQVIDEQRDAKCSSVIFDFSRLNFVEPVGVVVLANVIEYFKLLKCKVKFKNHSVLNSGTKFLDDAAFFQRYLNKRIFQGSATRSTTIPLEIVGNDFAQDYLLNKLIPWVASAVGMSESSLSSVRSSLEEVLHNIRDHSGVDHGCAFAQHFPNKNEIQIAISDFGCGIPSAVRSSGRQETDSAALKLACQEGFTTKSNVRNRGAGLPTLIKFVTQRNRGMVSLVSGRGDLSAIYSGSNKGVPKITARSANDFYPGTLVKVTLRTDTLELSAEDATIEPFKW